MESSSSPSDEATVSSAAISFGKDVHSLSAIKKAAYRFIGTATITIDLGSEHIACELVFPKPLNAAAANAEVNRFRDEVLDQDLREIIAEETAPIRNSVLAFAFSRTGLQGE